MDEPALLAGLILAAGESSRMGTDKAMLPWPPPAPGTSDPPRRTLLSSAIIALDPLTRLTVVVGGRNADSIATTVEACSAYLVRNLNPEFGQFSSLQIGLKHILEHGCNAAIITPVDCPPLLPTSLQLLLNSFLRALADGYWAVAPEHDGKHGHPLLAGPDMIEAFLHAQVNSDARTILHAHRSKIVYVRVPDPLVKAGLNTPAEYVLHGLESPPSTN